MRAASGLVQALAAVALGAAVLRAEETPASVDLRPQLEDWGLVPRSQGARGTCSVFAAAGALEFAVSRHTGRGTALSVEFLNWASNAVLRDPRDGGFFHELLRGFEEHGVCLEEDMPYQAEFDAALAPAEAAVARAKEIRALGLRVHWINPWKPEAGLSDEHLREIKAVLARGYPVAAGSSHSRLIVGCFDDPEQPGGGAFVMKDSAAAAYITMTYAEAKVLIGDVFWVEAPGRAPEGWEVVDGTPGAQGLARKARDPASGITFILVEPGTFQMGSAEDEVEMGDSFADERPQHEVEITKAFYLAETEVTVGQWREFARKTKYRTDAEETGEGGDTVNAAGDGVEMRKDAIWSKPIPLHDYEFNDLHPVTQVSWNDASAFCEEYGYRLPTEAEWEYACRAGTSTAYWWGENESDGQGTGNFADQAAKKKFTRWTVFSFDDGHVFTAPVGTYAANGWGLRDMLGNVWEWCADVYDERYYDRSPREDPLNAGRAGGGPRSLRGGSWLYDPMYCRFAHRLSLDPDARYDSLGFRVAR